MSRILFALSSPLIRNNGINTFIRETVNVLRNGDHEVDFITDGPAEINIQHYFDRYYTPMDNYEYPKFEQVDGHPNVTYLPHITNRIRTLFNSIKVNGYDFIVSNDAQCTAAFVDTGVPLVHYVHTAGLITGPEADKSYLSADYIRTEQNLLRYCLVAVQTDELHAMIGAPKMITLGMCMDTHPYFTQTSDIKEGVLFLGEGSKRKGADVFKQVTEELNVPVKLMLSAEPEIQFEESELVQKKTFAPGQEDAKIKFMRSSVLHYFPSRGEVMPYAVLETLLSQPVLLHKEYKWTKSFEALGATMVTHKTVKDKIKELLEHDSHNPTKVEQYFKDSANQWLDFADNFKEHFK